MKKFLLFLILCVIKLSAYEYIVYSYSPYNRIRVFTDNQGRLFYQQIDNGVSGNYIIPDSSVFWTTINAVANNYPNYTRRSIFEGYYKNDYNFLNDLYTQSTIQFLNFLYNPNTFSLTSHVIYENYQILYNSDGFAVVSIVNGQWAGLYDNSTMGISGNLYNSNGSLVYVDGQEPSFFQKIWSSISDPLMKDFNDANSGLIPLKWILAFIIIFMLVYFCIRLYKNALGVEKWKI